MSTMFSKCARLLPVARRIQYSATERSRKGCTSSLYVPGDLQSESFVVVTPNIDFSDRFEDIVTLQKNVSQRGLAIDVLALKKSWDKLQLVQKFKMELEKKLSANAALRKSLLDSNKKQTELLKQESVKLRQDMKAVNEEIWSLERSAIIGALSLPNYIHSDTPLESGKVLHEFSVKPHSVKKHTHVEIAEKLDLVDFYDSSFYFLKGDAAKFELGISFLFTDIFKDDGFTLMCNSDFGRSVAVEGVGMDPTDSNSVFTLEKETNQSDPNIRLHLVGGASLISFSMYHAKSIVFNKDLPLRYVTMGKHYSPGNSIGLHGLFSSWQNSAVEAFILTSDQKEAFAEFESLLKKLKHVYESLGYHFRVEYLPAGNLKPWESLHASFQMYSSSLESYIEVANVSLCDDYISKRLLIRCTENINRPKQYAHVVSSTLISVPRVLGCVLENCADKFIVPAEIKQKLGGCP